MKRNADSAHDIGLEDDLWVGDEQNQRESQGLTKL
jgi:hypothetical protein